MNRHLLAAALLCTAAAVQAEPARYRLDPDHSFVHFEILHFGTATIHGRFGPVAGDVLLDRAAGRGEVGLRIATGTVDTGVRLLDARLKQPDLLNTAADPEAYFVSRSFRFEGDRVKALDGEFTLRGISQPLTLTARFFACRLDEQQREVCGGEFEARFNRSAFGLTFGLPFVADAVRVVVQAEGLRQ